MDIQRIVAHTDFDGLVSALLLRELFGVEETVFTEPWLITEGKFVVHKNDAVVDLPRPQGGCLLWIDHHRSSAPSELAPHEHFLPDKKSCPSVIWESFPERRDVLERFLPLIVAADKIDSADYAIDDLRSPTAAMRIAMSIDSGLANADDAYRLFLLEQLTQHSLEIVAGINIVAARYAAAVERQEVMLAVARERAVRHGTVLVVDLSDHERGAGLMQFLLFLEHDVSVAMFLYRGEQERVRLSVGENMFLRLNAVDIGALMRKYGGGGHKQAGGCTIPLAQKDEIIEHIVLVMNQNDSS